MYKKIILVLCLLALPANAAQADLTISTVNAYHYSGDKNGFAWFNLTDYVDVEVKNTGSGDAGSFAVRLSTKENLIGEQAVTALKAGESTPLVFNWTPVGKDEQNGGTPITYSLAAEVDPYNKVDEADESNNKMTVTETVKYNGYSGDEPLYTFSHGTLHGGIYFTTGDGIYMGLYKPGDSQTVHYNIDVPSTSSVKLARLNVYHTWCKNCDPYPEMKIEITNSTGTYTVMPVVTYNDRPGSFSNFNLPWGNYVFDLTPYISGRGSYTVKVINMGTGNHNFCIAAPGLMVLYEDNSMPLIEYWLAEGADVLMGGSRSDSGSYLANEESINNATFAGDIDLKNVNRAVLGVISPWGGAAWAQGMGSSLYFNDRLIGTDVYQGYNANYEDSIGAVKFSIGPNPWQAQVGANLTDVTGYIRSGKNIVGQGDNGDNMMPSNAFLVMTLKAAPTSTPQVMSTRYTPEAQNAAETPGFEVIASFAALLAVLILLRHVNKKERM
ncbi:MAG: DUF3344 domain-containing protein [Euryarchaeota archaeon]|nr:DUF3344 domain-containing protein [Euryarchaeota archaeon]